MLLVPLCANATNEYAEKSRKILDNSSIKINDPKNLVWVKTSTHRRMHTNEYYMLVYTILENAYSSAGDDKTLRKAYVSDALEGIKTIIHSLEAITW